ncbi:unnamed protein product [Larinioides sclopetarius]|uniref:Uncharacterized protein n=1 Tax=Larinioides sclopetarius TaxID=280406 RepID=A0AAV2BYY1_9ARAC
MLFSHDMYLRFVMFACIKEHDCYNSIFRSFINVCVLVKLLCDETLEKTGVNFCDLVPDIIIVFYNGMIEETFCRSNLGFQRFVEYIRGHKYLRWNLNKDHSVSPDETNVAVNYRQLEFDEKIKKELKKEDVIEIEVNPDEVEMDDHSCMLASGVLAITLFDLPNLPNCEDLKNTVTEYQKNKILKNIEEKRRTQGAEKSEDVNVSLAVSSSTNSELKTNDDPKQQGNIGGYEKIIQAVIKHNHAKKSSNETSNNRIQKEADGTLEHLKDTIESLIEVLDKCDDE